MKCECQEFLHGLIRQNDVRNIRRVVTTLEKP